jgi:hypothetical protein
MIDLETYRPQIEAALSYGSGTLTCDDLLALVAKGECQSWVNGDSVMVTEVITYPRAKHLHVFVAGGNLAELEVLSRAVEAWAKGLGCTHATLIGREGWERTFLGRTGWTKKAVLMERKF